MRSRLCRILLTLMMAAGVIVVPASSAYACRCAPPASPRAQMHYSDAVFTGRLVEVETRSGDGAHPAEWYERVFTFQVESVYKGAVTSVEKVASQSGEGSCGLDLHGDGPFLVFADSTGAQPRQPRYFSDSCTGSRRVSDTDPVPYALGPATPPDALSSPPTAGPSAEPTAAVVAATPDVEDTPLTSPEVISLALMALVGAVLAVLWRLRRPSGR